MNMWRGLREDDLDQLRVQARDRARERDCSTVELAAAAETATDLIDSGIGHDQATDVMGAALKQGYSAREMRELGHAVRVTAQRGGPPEEMVGWVQSRLRSGDPMQRMVREMMNHGWLGPRDMSGPGGNSPVDNVVGGPGRHGGGDRDGGGHQGGGNSNGQR
jgi:hypothetical protein